MPLATLSIDLEARLAKFEQGMGQAVRVSQESADRIESSFKGVGKFIAGLGIAAAVTSYIGSLKTAIDTADRIDDLSEKYGIAADKLSVYSFASQVAGTSSEAFSTGLNKLSKNLAAAAGGGKEQIAVFDSLGVRYKESNGQLRAVDDVLLDVAEKFKGYEDGAGKAALAQELFGKSGAELIPLLNKGRDGISKLSEEAKALGAAFGTDLAKQAGDFNDNLQRLKLASEGAKISLVGELLPSLNATLEAFIRNAKEGGVLIGVLRTLREGASIRLGFDEVGKLKTEAQGISVEIERVTNQITGLAVALDRDPGNDTTRRRYETLRGKLKELQGQAGTTSDAIKRLAEIASPVVNYGNEGRNNPLARVAAPVTAKGGSASSEVDKTAKAYQNLTQKISERISVSQAELEAGTKITESQKFGIDVVSKLADRELKFSEAQKIAIGALLSKSLALDETQRLQALYTKTAEESLKLSYEEADALRRIGDAREQAVLTLRDETAEYGLSAEQIDKLRTARLQEKLAREQQRLATLEGLELTGRETEELKRNIGELEKVIAERNKLAGKGAAFATDGIAGADRAVTDYLKRIGQAGIETQQAVSGGLDALSNNLTDSLAAGKLDVSGFVSYTLKEVFRLSVVQPFLKSVFSLNAGSTSDSGSLVSSFIKLFAADGAVLSAHGVVPFAKGEVFDSPRLFKFAQGGAMATGVLGEAGPEAIMPLRRGADGKLGVAAAGGRGQGSTVTNNISIGAGVTRGDVMSLLQAYGAQLKGEILSSINNGGAFAR